GLAASAVSPSVDITQATINAARAMHAGHMSLLLQRSRSPRTLRFGALANTLVDVRPALPHPRSMVILNQSQCRVVEFDQRSSVHLAQPVLHVRDDRIRHEQRPSDFQKCRPLDCLHVSPEMTVLVT